MDIKALMKAAREEADQRLPFHELAGKHLGLPVTAHQRTFYLSPCPGCGKKNKFMISEKGWGCPVTSCSYHNDPQNWQYRGRIDMIMEFRGLDFHEAQNEYLRMAGVPNPQESEEWQEILRKSKAKKEREKEARSKTPPPAKKTATEIKPQPPEALPAPTDVTPANIWAKIHSRLNLDKQHREELKVQRGFTDNTIDHFGLISSHKGNRGKLSWVPGCLPKDALLTLGILSFKKSGEHKLNAQLCGAPVYDDDTNQWKDRNPVIIPYRNLGHKITWLRPHKIGISPKDFFSSKGVQDTFKEHQTNAHPFLALDPPKPLPYFKDKLVITEAEYKAMALWQCGIPSISIPGISITRSEPFLQELVEYIRGARFKHVIVAFDNDDKSDKPDPWNRHDTEVYAAYCAHALRERGFFTQIAEIPDKWRIDGKADWDGMLAQIRKSHPREGHTAEAAKVFGGILRSAKGYDGQMRLVEEDPKSRIITAKLRRLIYKPHIKTGGRQEEKDARIIRTSHPDFLFKTNAKNIAALLLECQGAYWVHRPPKAENLPRLLKLKNEIEARIAEEESPETKAQLIGSLRACEYAINGPPKIISNFTAKCEFTVRTAQDTIERLLVLTNKDGEVSRLVRPPNKAFASTVEFRKFTLDCGNFTWRAGTTELDLLVEDIARFAAWRQIRELPFIGYDDESKLWILGDCAVTPDGEYIFPDESDIIWQDGIGYRIDPIDLKAKAMRSIPRLFRDKPHDLTHQEYYNRIDWKKERDECQQIFEDFTRLMWLSFGDLTGALVMGIIFAYASGPEILKQFTGHPGAWLTGRMSSGKTQTLKMALKAWGFDSYQEINVGEGTTPTALDNILADYSFLPVHLDEFREDDVKQGKLNSIRNSFNRASKSKGTIDPRQTTRGVIPRTTPIITGENSTTDSATRSRFIQATLSEQTRLPKGDEIAHSRNFKEFQALSGELFRLVRFILKNRADFSRMTCTRIDDLISDESFCTRINSARTRLSYATGLASYESAEKLFCPQAAASEKLLAFTIEYAAESDQRTLNVNFVNQFWRDMASLLQVDPNSLRFCEFMYASYNQRDELQFHPNNFKGEGNGQSMPVLCFHPVTIYDLYTQHLRKSGRSPSLRLEDLQDEVRKDPYWIPGPKVTNGKGKTRSVSHRMSLNKKQMAVWVINISKMEEGPKEGFLPFFTKDEGDI